MKNSFYTRLSQILFLLAAQCGAAHATVILSDASDGTVYRTATTNGAFNIDLIVGGTDNANYAAIAIFALPDLGVGGSITAATLTFTVRVAGKMPTANADIYGLGYLSTSTPALDRIWQTISNTETRTGTELGTNLGGDSPVKLVDNAVTAGTQMNVGDTTVVTGAPLVGFLNSMYNTYGAQAGDYVVFRVNGDADEISGVSGVNHNFRYGGDGTTQVTKLDVTVIPEVSGMLLSAFGAAGFLLRRRRA